MIEPPIRHPKDAEDVPRVDSVRHVGSLLNGQDKIEKVAEFWKFEAIWGKAWKNTPCKLTAGT